MQSPEAAACTLSTHNLKPYTYEQTTDEEQAGQEPVREKEVYGSNLKRGNSGMTG